MVQEVVSYFETSKHLLSIFVRNGLFSRLATLFLEIFVSLRMVVCIAIKIGMKLDSVKNLFGKIFKSIP